MTSTAVTALFVVTAIVGCSDRARSTGPSPSREAGALIAMVDAMTVPPDNTDASVAAGVAATPTLDYSAKMLVKGRLSVSIDPSTLRGEITFYTAGPALTRHLKVVARPVDATTTLVFDGYFQDDHQTIRRVRKPRPAQETLVVGRSIVGRVVTVGDEARFYVDGDVDWVTGTLLDVHDGYAQCVP